MKRDDMTSLLKHQLDMANETIRLLNLRIEELVETVSALKDELEERDKALLTYSSKMDELLGTVRSLEEALTKKELALGKQRNINKGLAKLMENKSEKQTVKDEAPQQRVSDDGGKSALQQKPKYNPKERGNNGARRDMHYDMECQVHDVYPNDPAFDKNTARFIKSNESIRYEFIPPKFIKHIYRLRIYSQNGVIMQGKSPLAPLLNSSYDGSFIAGLAELRFMESMPVERIVDYFNNHGFEINKNTAHGLLKKTESLFENLYKALREAIVTDDYVSCDETYSKVLVKEKNHDGKGVKKGYVWNMVANTLGLVYFFYKNGSRSEDVITDMLGQYTGTMQSDAFAPYRKLGGERFPNIVRLSCLQHVKRKFIDIEGNEDAQKMVELINRLYQAEHRHPDKDDGTWTEEDNRKWRKKYAPPILKEIRKELKRIARKEKDWPESELGRAVAYMQNEMRDIENIFTSGKYRLDNNVVERYNRAISLSRRNSLFFGSHKGAERAAIFYSLACSCRMQGINFYDYITDILNRLPEIKPSAPMSQYRMLLPDKWKSLQVSE